MSLSGHVRRPGNYEIEFAKVSFRDLIYDPDLGGGIRYDRQLKAFIPGGASSPWFGPQHLDISLANEKIAEAGSMAGSGSITVMDETTCVVRAAWRITRFFHRESCGQCTPCREGSGWIEKIMRRIEDGQGREADLDLLMDVCDNISPGVQLAPATNNDLPAWPVDPELGSFGHQDVPGRVPGPYPDGPLPVPARPAASEPGICLTRRPPTDPVAPATASGSGSAAVTTPPEPEGVGFTLDGRQLRAKKGELIIAAAERAGTYIPRFCYHPRMKPVGMCRMCLVEIKGPRGFSPFARLLLAGHRRHGGSDRQPEGQEGTGRRTRVPAREPSPGLPGMRQGRRVPAAGPDAWRTGRARHALSRKSGTGTSPYRFLRWC